MSNLIIVNGTLNVMNWKNILDTDAGNFLSQKWTRYDYNA
jgi:hypothetical protein